MSLAYVFIGFVNVLYIMGLNTAFIRFFTDEKEREEREKIFSTTILFLACISFLASLCLWLAAAPVASLLFQDKTYALYIHMMAVILFVDTLALFPLLILRALERSKRYATITVIRFMVTVALNVYFVLLLRKGVEGVLLSNMLASFIIFLILLPLTLTYMKRSFSFSPGPFNAGIVIFSFFIPYSHIKSVRCHIDHRFFSEPVTKILFVNEYYYFLHF